MSLPSSTAAKEQAMTNLPEACRATFQTVIEYVNCRRYPLLAESEDLLVKAQKAIGLATEMEMKRVIALSVSRVHEAKPAWMSERIFRESFRQSVAFPARYYLELKYDKQLRFRLGDRLAYEHLNTAVKVDLMGGLTDVIKNQVRNSLGCQLSMLASDSVTDILFFWCLARQTGCTEIFDRLTPLANLVTQAIPLGELKDELGVWILLVS